MFPTPVRVAIMGGKEIVKKYIPAVLECEKLSLIAILSRRLDLEHEELMDLLDEGQTIGLHSSCAYCREGEECQQVSNLLSRRDIDAVIIALPTEAMGEAVKSALSAGKHVLAARSIIEGVSWAEVLVERMEVIAARNGVTFSIMEGHRFNPCVTYARDLGRQMGQIEEIQIVDPYTTTEVVWTLNKSCWGTKPGNVRGERMLERSHFAAALRLFLPEQSSSEKVYGFGDPPRNCLVPLDAIRAVVQLKSGDLVNVATMTKSDIWLDINITYKTGTLRLCGTTITTRLKGGDENVVKTEKRSDGVKEAVAAWTEGLVRGQPDDRLSSRLALGDLELTRAVLKSAAQRIEAQYLHIQ